jgi:hypothetical protein
MSLHVHLFELPVYDISGSEASEGPAAEVPVRLSQTIKQSSKNPGRDLRLPAYDVGAGRWARQAMQHQLSHR